MGQAFFMPRLGYYDLYISRKGSEKVLKSIKNIASATPARSSSEAHAPGSATGTVKQ